MRIVLTADLHYNHPRSREPAEQVIDQINRAGGDVLVVVGDTAVPDANDGALEQCLSRFTFRGAKLYIAGNHELWTRDGGDSYAMYATELPRRVRALGWHWLEDDPFIAPGGDAAIVGSVGWYDYSFAQPSLEIPLRFYRSKISPGAAEYLGGEYAGLLADRNDLSSHAMSIVSRWNDGQFVHLGRADEQFLDELLQRLDQQLAALVDRRIVVAATHHLPFAELLPPPRTAQWDFAKAFLGADAIGRTLLRHTNVRHAFCGHSHFPAEATVGHIRAINIGSGYRVKTFKTLDV
jgi:predicted phosphodiesterase